MPDNLRFSNPDTMQKPPGYSHVVEVTGPGRTVYFAGQLGIDKSGKMGANAREQVEIAFENVKAALASVGATFDHVVKLNNYIVDISANIAHYREVRDKYVNKAAPPASTSSETSVAVSNPRPNSMPVGYICHGVVTALVTPPRKRFMNPRLLSWSSRVCSS